jgi:5-methylcytosine-specific restriction endonuclease McrA
MLGFTDDEWSPDRICSAGIHESIKTSIERWACHVRNVRERDHGKARIRVLLGECEYCLETLTYELAREVML